MMLRKLGRSSTGKGSMKMSPNGGAQARTSYRFSISRRASRVMQIHLQIDPHQHIGE